VPDQKDIFNRLPNRQACGKENEPRKFTIGNELSEMAWHRSDGVQIGWTRNGTHVEVAIEDEGPGISKMLNSSRVELCEGLLRQSHVEVPHVLDQAAGRVRTLPIMRSPWR